MAAGVISRTSTFSWNRTFRIPRPEFSVLLLPVLPVSYKKDPRGKPGGLLILEIISTKKPPNVSGGVSGNLVACMSIRRLPDTPPGSDKNIGNNNC